jgi:serine/threonine protein kinase/tetratricopeptide (TPR) repeat protein
VLCPFCRAENALDALRCSRCGLDFSVLDSDATLGGGPEGRAREPSVSQPAAASAGKTPLPGPPSSFGAGFSSPTYGYGPVSLQPGADFGARYRIETKLGEGGMGAVYKAFDRDLDRTVAIKLLRPEMVADANALARFKQELLLASKISHKNILRIHDLGDVNGLKFISMAYVEGEDLRGMMNREGRMSFDKIVTMGKQLCAALEAAAAEGVVHRDLKPQNVLVDKSGNIFISDFGLAKSLEAGAMAMTRTNEFLGTPRYMSPEQVQGGHIDHRSDLYAVGLILYEMVTGDVPFTGDSSLQVMYKRVKETPKDPQKLRPETPDYLSRIILRCLEKDLQRRYQSAREVLDDLEAARKPAHSRSLRIQLPLVEDWQWKWIAAGVALLLVLLLAIAPVRTLFFGGAGSHTAGDSQKAVSVLVADFQNGTGEPVFDGTLEPALNVALEGASFVSTYGRAQARKVMAQLKPDSTLLDEAAARLVAVREGVSIVVTGSIAPANGGYSISLKALDAATGKELYGAGIDARGKDDVLKAVSKLAARVRNALGDVTPESLQLAAAETFTTSSLEAAQAYARGQELQYSGKYQEAIASYLKATQLDPELGRAYTSIATIYSNMGRANDAENYFKLSFSKIDRMSDREKYRTRSAYYLATRNIDKAIEELAELVRRYPADSAGLSNLALGHFWKRDMSKALEYGRRAVELNPRDVLDRSNFGLYAMYAGDFETAMREHRAVLETNPSFVKSYLGLALSQLATQRVSDAVETYRRLAAVDASFAALGQADLALFEGRAQDAVAALEAAIQQDAQAKSDAESRALKLSLLSVAQRHAGSAAAAAASADKALAARKLDSVLYFAARAYIGAGREAKALQIAQDLGQRVDPDPRAYALLIQGEADLKRSRPREALQKFTDAHKLADTWLGRLALGRAYLELQQFTEAYSEFEACLNRRGEATALFLDEVPTMGLFPEVYYLMGRAQEGLQSPAAADSYRMFLKIRENGQDTALTTDARRRLTGR